MARIEPTDRSMPPAMMTSVMPSAMMLITAVCRTTLERFVSVRKCGDAMAQRDEQNDQGQERQQSLDHAARSSGNGQRA